MFTLHNLFLVLKDQGPPSRFLRNLRKGHLFGLVHINSHINQSSCQPKVAYGSKASAQKAAESMAKKRGVYFSNYKCLHCDGYHIGRNRDNREPNQM